MRRCLMSERVSGLNGEGGLGGLFRTKTEPEFPYEGSVEPSPVRICDWYKAHIIFKCLGLYYASICNKGLTEQSC